MTQQQPPRRYATGGFTGRGDPLRALSFFARGIEQEPAAPALPDLEQLLRDVQASAMLEAAARVVTLGLVREFGVTLPLRAFRKRPKPLPRLEAMVLAKLEGVAVHLGAP